MKRRDLAHVDRVGSIHIQHELPIREPCEAISREF